MTTEDSSPTSLLYITHSIYTFAFTLFVLSATPLPLPSFSDLLPLIPYEMASVTASSVKFSSVSCLIKQNQVSNLKKTSLSFSGKAFQSRRLPALRFNVSCAAKPETVDKVVGIVRKQLALADDKEVNGESQFSKLGADSLDTVEIVMGLEEEFGICVEEESAQSISTVQEAADLIESLLEKK